MQVPYQQNYEQAGYGGNVGYGGHAGYGDHAGYGGHASYGGSAGFYNYPNVPTVSYQGGNSYFQTPTSYNQAYNYPYNYQNYGGCGNCYSYPSYGNFGYHYQGYGYQNNKKDCGCGCGGSGNCGQYGISFDRITPQYPRKLGRSFVTSGSNQYQNKGVSHDYVSQTAPFQSQRRVTYQPYTRKYFDYEEYIQYIPVQKSYWDYQKVTKQTDFIPKQYYQSKIQYIPQERVSQKVRYIPIQQQIIHVPQQSLASQTKTRQVVHQTITQQIAKQNLPIKTMPFQSSVISHNALNNRIIPAVSTVQMVPRYQMNRNVRIQQNIIPVLQTHLIKNAASQLRQNQKNIVNHTFNGNNRIQSSFGVQANEQYQIKNQNRQTIGQSNMTQSGVRVVESKFQQNFPDIRHQNRFVQTRQRENYEPSLNKRQSQASLVNQISRQENFR